MLGLKLGIMALLMNESLLYCLGRGRGGSSALGTFLWVKDGGLGMDFLALLSKSCRSCNPGTGGTGGKPKGEEGIPFG